MPNGAVDVAALGRWIREFARVVSEQKGLLTELDSAIGDADHGANLDRGLTAVVAALDGTPPSGASALLKATGMTMVRTVGGASGPLYGTLFLRMSTAVPAPGPTSAGAGTDAGDDVGLDAAGLAAALRAGLDGVVARGRAATGDKTMVDALAPACDALDAALDGGADLASALAAASTAADAGRDATTPMLARKGRASYLGERSIGHQDPGATSVALLVAAAASQLVRADRPAVQG
jgi:phosphoenolpyruvate---glycerone phosphotransferase subunit DhaL